MRLLSASDAISPAWVRTKAILFQPFRRGRSWKLSATAYVAVLGSLFMPILLAFLGISKPSGGAETRFALQLALFSAIGMAVSLLLYYLGSRMQFVLFEVVLKKTQIIAPVWKKYASHTWRWIGLKLAIIVPLGIIVSWPVLSRFRHIGPQFSSSAASPSPEFLHAFALIFFLMFFGIFFLILCSSLLSDFVLPFIAIEEVSICEATRRFSQLLKAEPWQMISYIFFKVMLALAGGVGWYLGILLAMIVAAIPLGIVAALGWFLFHSFGLAGHVLITAGGLILYLAFMAFVFYMEIGLYGWIVIFLQAYALYFLGGRYPLLGNILEPNTSDAERAIAPPPLPLMPESSFGSDPTLG